MSVCLDSWAVLEWLDGGEPAAGRVDAVLGDRPVMSWINVAEVYYRVERDHGRRDADEVVTHLRRLLELDLPTTGRVIDAARVKAVHPIALADCFAVATAASRGVALLTGDPEIVEANGLVCEVQDLRRA